MKQLASNNCIFITKISSNTIVKRSNNYNSVGQAELSLSNQQDCISLALRAPYGTLHVHVSEASCPNFEPRTHARFTGLISARQLPSASKAARVVKHCGPSRARGKPKYRLSHVATKICFIFHISYAPASSRAFCLRQNAQRAALRATGQAQATSGQISARAASNVTCCARS